MIAATTSPGSPGETQGALDGHELRGAACVVDGDDEAAVEGVRVDGDVDVRTV